MEILAQFKLILGLFFTVFLLLVYSQAENVTYCDNSRHYIVNVQNFGVSPDPMLVGRLATFTISASTRLHVYTETRDLCEEVSCHVAAGNFVLSHSQTLPAFTPLGS